MTGSSLAGPNPYVGPRPFEPGEKLYGRENEISELYYLWQAERIVLLHSPSGAGKSSLIQAGLLPRIRTSFDVWGPTRVNQEPPASLAAAVNRYLLSAMQGFEEDVPERLRRPPEELAGLRLAEYVEKRPRQRKKASKSVALLFDQFEEVLTVDPLAEEAKWEFFDQLGELLRNPRVWALFVLREDYLAPLDPYTRQVPTHLKNRFRIDLLSLDGAREAMVQPALTGGREFPAADRLLHDLATMKVQQPDGSFALETGRHVEPVQLQVVCFRLWDTMPAEHLSIGPEDLARFGDVTEALSGYYADSVTRISGGTMARERAIRDWFSERLITAGNIRGQVLRGAGESEGLANEIIEEFLDTHLVRSEKRAGATWYELAHDRLIEPVQSDNTKWRAEHLTEVQQRATLWEGQGRPPELLLKDEKLAAAESWSVGSVVITAIEALFLEESRKAQDVADRERRQARRIKRLGIAAMVIGVLALVAGVFAVVQMVEANRQRQEADEQRELALENERKARDQEKAAVAARDQARMEQERAESERWRAEEEKRAADAARDEATAERRRAEEQEAIAVEKSVEADKERRRAEQQTVIAEEKRREAEDERRRAEAEQQRADAEARESARLRRVAEAEALAIRTTSMTEPAQHKLAALLALEAYRLNQRSGGAVENPRIYDALRRALQRLGSDRLRVFHGHRGAVRALAVAPDGRTLASGSEDGEVRRVDLTDSGAEPTVLERFSGAVRALAWSADGERLAIGGFDGAVRVRTVSFAPRGDGEDVRELRAGGSAVGALAFHPAGSRLAAGDASGAVLLWADDGEPAVLLPGTTAPSEDETDERTVDDMVASNTVAGDTVAPIRGLAWSSGGALAAASEGRGVLLWTTPEPGTAPRLLAERQDVRSVAFSPDGRRLAAGTAAGPIVLWDPSRDIPPVELPGHTARVESVRFHPGRSVLASASFDGTVRLWDVEQPDALPLILEGHDFWVWSAAFSPDGERLVSGSGDRTIHLWTTSSGTLAAEVCQVVQRNLTAQEWSEYLPDGVEYEETCAAPPGTGAGAGEESLR